MPLLFAAEPCLEQMRNMASNEVSRSMKTFLWSQRITFPIETKSVNQWQAGNDAGLLCQLRGVYVQLSSSHALTSNAYLITTCRPSRLGTVQAQAPGPDNPKLRLFTFWLLFCVILYR